jgi:hypothetical protein
MGLLMVCWLMLLYYVCWQAAGAGGRRAHTPARGDWRQVHHPEGWAPHQPGVSARWCQQGTGGAGVAFWGSL